jgi:type I restriction enzyme S subunit
MEAELLHKKKVLAPRLRFSGVEGSWKNILYGDIYTFYTTNSFSRDNLNYDFGEVKNIHYGDIHTKFATLFDIKKEEVPFINSEIDIKNIKNESYCQEGDLVIADASEDYADIGKTIELINLNNEKIIAGLHTFLARPKKYEMAKGFAGYLVQSWNFRKQVMVIAQGTKVLSLSTGRLANVKINIPTLPEQQKIASFLSAVDEKIQQLTRKKELLEQYKKGVMQQLFSGKLRFKDDNGKAFPKWEEKRLGDITILLKDGTHGTHKDYPEGYHYLLSAKNIVNGSIKIDLTDRRISEEEYNSIYKNYKLRVNDILLTIVGTIGRVAIYKNEKNVAFQRSVAFFRFKDQSADFLFQLMNESKFQKQLDLRKVISAQPGIYLGDLAKIPVKLPCLEEQKKIANYLSKIDNKIEIVTKQITKTQTFKKGLLQQMFV